MAARPLSFRPSRIDLLMLMVVIVWGVNHTVVKWLLIKMSPWSFNIARFTLSAAAATLLLWTTGSGLRGIPRRDLVRMIGIGLLGNTVYQALFIQGIAWTTAGNAALFVNMSPLWTALIAAGLGADRIGARGWGGLVVAMVGAAIVAMGGHAPGGDGRPAAGWSCGGPGGSTGPSAASPWTGFGCAWWGDGLTLLASVCWAGYTVASQDLLARHSPLRLTAVGLIIGTAGMWATSVPAVPRQDWGALTWLDWGAIAFSGLGPLVLCYTAWAEGVKHVGPSRTAVYANLIPIVGVLAAAWALHEPLSWKRVLGAALAISGVYMARTSGPPSPPRLRRHASRTPAPTGNSS